MSMPVSAPMPCVLPSVPPPPPPPPNWLDLPDDLVVLVFKIVNRDMPGSRLGYALGRKVCKDWCRAITDDLSASLESFQTGFRHISLLHLHRLFPNLKVLVVQYLWWTRDHYALFYFRKLDRLKVRTRTDNGVIWLAMDTTTEMMQVSFGNWSIRCPKCLPQALREWYDDHLSDDPQFDYSSSKSARAISRVPFGVKGVGRRTDTPILHQALGITHKPVGWDIGEELSLLIHPSQVGERLPFIQGCHKVAVEYTSVEEYVQPIRAIRGFVESTVLPGATVWVCGSYPYPKEDVIETYRGRTMIWTPNPRMHEARPALLVSLQCKIVIVNVFLFFFLITSILYNGILF